MSTDCMTLPDFRAHQLACFRKGKSIIGKFLPVKQVAAPQIKREIIYRCNGITKEKIVEYDAVSGEKKRIIYFDYYDDCKIKKIEDFEDNIKIFSTSFSLFKSVTEFDKFTGQKIKTTNYSLKDDSKIASVYDYDIKTEKIIKISVYRSDGKSIAFVKEIAPDSGLVIRCINYKKNSTAISSISKFEFTENAAIKTTYYYNMPLYFSSPDEINKKLTADALNKKVLGESQNRHYITKLIDDLYRNPRSFSCVNVT